MFFSDSFIEQGGGDGEGRSGEDKKEDDKGEGRKRGRTGGGEVEMEGVGAEKIRRRMTKGRGGRGEENGEDDGLRLRNSICRESIRETIQLCTAS